MIKFSLYDIRNKDVLDDMAETPDMNYTTILSDPPYNLGSKWIIGENGKYQQKRSTDFMNKWSFGGDEWEQFFKQAFRVLRYGGYCILFSIDRQIDPLCYFARLAGFEVCQSLYWYFISGFPKSLDVSKVIDKHFGAKREISGSYNPWHDNAKRKKIKKGEIGAHHRSKDIDLIDREVPLTIPATDKAKQYDGYKAGIAPFKPCLETILIFRKPCKESPVKDLLNGDGAACVNIDAGRVEFVNKKDNKEYIDKRKSFDNLTGKKHKGLMNSPLINNIAEKGRYPAQLFVDKYTAMMLDSQSGEKRSQSGGKSTGRNFGQNYTDNNKKDLDRTGHDDLGGISKILHTINDLVFYEPKASTAERDAGLYEKEKQAVTDGRNKSIQHPTVKPISLIKKIALLFKLPENQKWYVPFSGVCSEVIGLIKAGVSEKDITACEISKEYIDIGLQRIEYWKNMTDAKRSIDDEKQIKMF
jgi:DNA modification methylase